MNNNCNIKNGSLLSGGADDDSTTLTMPKSPGSFMGSSIRSNQVHSFDIESVGENSTSHASWKLGMPWFGNSSNKIPMRNNHNHSNNNSNIIKTNEPNRYYGGIMKASGEPAASPGSMTTNNSRHFRPFRKNSKHSSSSIIISSSAVHVSNNTDNNQQQNCNNINRNNNYDTSIPISRTKSAQDSIADFDDSEWTPPDSSYGAACPVCGFIPKHVRQMIEMSLIAAMVFLLIYLLVTTSMKIADAHRQEGGADGDISAADQYFSSNNNNRTGNSASGNNVVTDDDVYVEYSNNAIDDDSNNEGDGDDAVVVNDDYVQNINDDYVDDYNNVASDDDGDDNYYQNYYNNRNYDNYNYNNNRYYGYNDDYNGGNRQLFPDRNHINDWKKDDTSKSFSQIRNRIKRYIGTLEVAAVDISPWRQKQQYLSEIETERDEFESPLSSIEQ